MKKLLFAVLCAMFCVCSTHTVAQTTKFIKSLNFAKIEPIASKGTGLVRNIPGVYIPAGTTWTALERKVASAAQKAGFSLNKKDARVIAYNPILLRQFQQEVGHPIFENRPLPFKEGAKILQANQAKFAQARANHEYTAKWEEFMNERSNITNRSTYYLGDNTYLNPSALAHDIYKFYVKYIGLDHLPRVKSTLTPNAERIICEFPLDYFKLQQAERLIYAKDFVVLAAEDGYTILMPRKMLGQQGMYQVIK